MFEHIVKRFPTIYFIDILQVYNLTTEILHTSSLHSYSNL